MACIEFIRRLFIAWLIWFGSIITGLRSSAISSSHFISGFLIINLADSLIISDSDEGDKIGSPPFANVNNCFVRAAALSTAFSRLRNVSPNSSEIAA